MEVNSKIDANVKKLKDVLSQILEIPNFQRPYHWDYGNVKQLLQDVYDSWKSGKQSYRIGSIILYDPQKQDRIIKCLSMLQVTFRNRIYKNWLQEVLKWYIPSTENDISKIDYLQKLDNLALGYYKLENEIDKATASYAQGTDTPHFLFNFIDYLYWVAYKTKYNDNKQENEKIANLDNVSDFNFNYRNSIEHHLPQSFEGQNYNKTLINNLGNLCLVNKSANSRMNNESPIGKADKNDRYYNSKLNPKRKIMYDITNTKNEWGKTEIDEHYNNVVKLLKQRTNILK